MAEIRKITCDMCGREIREGDVLKPSSRRRISGGKTTNGAYRFDLCDACFDQIQKACVKKREGAAQ